MVPLFLYDTLLDCRVLARQSGDARLARRMVPARLAGFRRVFLRGTPYPTLVAGEAAVAGMLIRPTAAGLARLKAYEGPGYRLVPVVAGTRRGRRRARAWMAMPWQEAKGLAWPC